jgi:hypothetical protein
MWVDCVNNIYNIQREPLDWVDLGSIGNCVLWDKICERPINFDGNRGKGWWMYDDGNWREGWSLIKPYRVSADAFLRFSVNSGESVGQFLQISNLPLRNSVILHSSPVLTYETYADNVAAKFVSTRPIVAEAAGTGNFQLARKWLKQCRESHDGCFRSSIDFMPKN